MSVAQRMVLAVPVQGRWRSGREREVADTFLISGVDRRHIAGCTSDFKHSAGAE